MSESLHGPKAGSLHIPGNAAVGGFRHTATEGAHKDNIRIRGMVHDGLNVGVHPGYTATKLQHNGPTVGGKSIWSRLYTVTNKIMAQGVDKGILPMLYAATEDDVNGGDYIGPKTLFGTRGYASRIKSSNRSYNLEDSKTLWKLSEEMTSDKFQFKNKV